MQHCLEPTHPMTLQAPLHAPHQLPNHAFAQHPDGADALAPPQLPQPPHSASAPHSLPHIAHIVSTAAGLTHATLLGAANAPTLVPNLAQAFAGNRLQTLDSNMSTVSHFKALPRTDSPTSWTSLMRGRRQPAGQQLPTADVHVSPPIPKRRHSRKRRMLAGEQVPEAVVATQYNSRQAIPTVSAASTEHAHYAAALPPSWPAQQRQPDSSDFEQEQSMQQLQTDEVTMAPPNKRRKRKHKLSTAAPAAAAMAPVTATATVPPAVDQTPVVSPSAAAFAVPAILPAAQPTNSRTAAAAAPAALSRPQQPLSGPLPQQLMSHQQDLQHQHPPGHLQGDSAALQSTDSEIVSGSSVGATPGRLLG